MEFEGGEERGLVEIWALSVEEGDGVGGRREDGSRLRKGGEDEEVRSTWVVVEFRCYAEGFWEEVSEEVGEGGGIDGVLVYVRRHVGLGNG